MPLRSKANDASALGLSSGRALQGPGTALGLRRGNMPLIASSSSAADKVGMDAEDVPRAEHQLRQKVAVPLYDWH